MSMYAIMLCSKVAKSLSSSSSRRLRSCSPKDRYLNAKRREPNVKGPGPEIQSFLAAQKKILLLKNINASYGILVQPCRTFQSSPVVPGPFPSPRAPTWQHLRRRPPRTAAGPTAWSVLCLSTGTQNICSSFTLQSCTDFIISIGGNRSVLCQSTRKLYTPRQSTPHN